MSCRLLQTSSPILAMPSSLLPFYRPAPISFINGAGVWLFDDHSNRYLDAISGVAVSGLGHCHPSIVAALREQSERFLHCSNLYTIDEQESLARELTAISGMEFAFFVNSGAEANETAIKLARLYARQQKHTTTPCIAVVKNAFHGRTLGALAATEPCPRLSPFSPLPKGFVQVDFDNLHSLREAITSNPDIVAVLLEPIQGEGGIRIPDEDYLRRVRVLCDENKILMILDEIQTGMGRTGQWFCYQHYALLPDIITLAKGLANGVPIGACLCKDAVARCADIGLHGSTFGGNPLACRVARSVIKTIRREGLLEHVREISRYLMDGLKASLDLQKVQEIRGKGLMIGIETIEDCQDLVGLALQEGVLINVTKNRVVRLLPPLIIEKSEVDFLIEVLQKSLKKLWN